MSVLLDERVYVRTLLEIQPRPIHDDTENERATAMLEKLSSLERLTPEHEAVPDSLLTLLKRMRNRSRCRRRRGWIFCANSWNRPI